MPEPLSPAAQAVLDAFNREARPEPHHQREAIAAALEALADRVAPEGRLYYETVPDQGVFASTEPPARFRAQILSIAAELLEEANG